MGFCLNFACVKQFISYTHKFTPGHFIPDRKHTYIKMEGECPEEPNSECLNRTPNKHHNKKQNKKTFTTKLFPFPPTVTLIQRSVTCVAYGLLPCTIISQHFLVLKKTGSLLTRNTLIIEASGQVLKQPGLFDSVTSLKKQFSVEINHMIQM